MRKIFFTALLLSATMSAFALCQGTGADHDATYYGTDPNHKDWTLGYTWSARTEGTSVVITFATLDTFEGAATPYLFLYPGSAEFREQAMTGSPTNATVTLSGQAEGTILAFMFKLPVAGGCAYSGVITYTVGDDCAGGGQGTDTPIVETACSGTSTEVDPFYTENDGAACKSLTEGYTYEFRTTESGVELKVNFLDPFIGFAAPYAFVFTSSTDVNLHDEVALRNAGQLCYGTLTGLADGSTLTVLVKAAYAEHVVFTRRLTYVVGTSCEEDTALPVTRHSSSVIKTIRDGQLIIIRDGVRYDALGSRL